MRPTPAIEIARREFLLGAAMTGGCVFACGAVSETTTWVIGPEWFKAREIVLSGRIGRVLWAQADAVDSARQSSLPLDSTPFVELLASIMMAADLSHPLAGSLFSAAGVWVAKWEFSGPVMLTLNSATANPVGVRSVIRGTDATLHIGDRSLGWVSDSTPRARAGCIGLPVDLESAMAVHPRDRIVPARWTGCATAAVRLLENANRHGPRLV